MVGFGEFGGEDCFETARAAGFGEIGDRFGLRIAGVGGEDERRGGLLCKRDIEPARAVGVAQAFLAAGGFDVMAAAAPFAFVEVSADGRVGAEMAVGGGCEGKA